MSRLHLKGTPDFSMLSESKVFEYRDLMNSLIKSYGEDSEKVKILTEIWDDLKNECADRISERPEKDNFSHLRNVLKRNKKLRT